MNAKYVLISSILLTFAIHVNGQLTIDAGMDTTYCFCRDSIQLGGNPTVWGGIEPYTYKWELMPVYFYDYHVQPSDLINDSTSANPFIRGCGFINDTVTFVLTVTDAQNNTVADSLNIIVSAIAMQHLVYFRPTIDQGDSVLIYPVNIDNGIPPFSYHWTPEAGLSNPFIRKPYAKPDTSTRFTCLVTDAIGCSAIDIVDVVVNPNKISEIANSMYSSFVYPNPIASNSIIEFSNPLNEKRNIKVLNLNGQVLFEDWFYTNKYDIGEKVNQNGFYFFIIKNDKKIITTGKFIKK